MPSTHLSLHYHLVFSTKDRRPLIVDAWHDRLHAYLGGAVRTLDGVPLAIGGTADHVHLLVRLRATHRLADVLREIKATSSKWVHETVGVSNFGWQDGYGAFTVSLAHADEIRQYIAAQEEHHRTQTFQEEYVAFLQRNGVEYDERYLW
jgi:putative transposase